MFTLWHLVNISFQETEEQRKAEVELMVEKEKIESELQELQKKKPTPDSDPEVQKKREELNELNTKMQRVRGEAELRSTSRPPAQSTDPPPQSTLETHM